MCTKPKRPRLMDIPVAISSSSSGWSHGFVCMYSKSVVGIINCHDFESMGCQVLRETITTFDPLEDCKGQEQSQINIMGAKIQIAHHCQPGLEEPTSIGWLILYVMSAHP